MKEPDTQLPPGFWTASQDHGRTAFPDGHGPAILSPERAPHQGHCGFWAVCSARIAAPWAPDSTVGAGFNSTQRSC